MVSLHVPRFFLAVEVNSDLQIPRWQFTLRKPDGEIWLQASDEEPDASGERLELLTVVRALEALDQPSLVTLVSANRYIQRGMRFGIPEWRSTHWQWERFGLMVPIKDADLWRRFDRALRFHSLKFESIRFDSAHTALRGPTRRRGGRARVACPSRLRPSKQVFS